MMKRRTCSNNKNRLSDRRGAGLVTSLASKLVGNASALAGKAINKGIDLLPIELHLPGGYQYCGPGTKLDKRLRRGDPGINPLDKACKEHDIAYSQSSDTSKRAVADKILSERAWQRVLAKDASVGEKAAAWAVTNIMKTKAKLGGGSGTRKPRTRRPRRRRRNNRAAATALRRLKSMVVAGKGLYLRPYSKTGGGSKKKKKLQRQRR